MLLHPIQLLLLLSELVDATTLVELVPRAGSDRPIFRSTVRDSSGFNNPDDPNDPSAAQKRHAVTCSFFTVSEIRVTFAIPVASPNNGRNFFFFFFFFFSSVPLFPACLNTTATVDLNISETQYINLGGEALMEAIQRACGSRRFFFLRLERR